MGITIENLQVDDLHANPNNPRKQVGDIDELASSIRSQGIKQPLLVTPNGETDIDGHKQYRVVIGHRRLAAARQSGLSTVPAIVEEMDARREREIMLVENTQRSDLTPVEEADGYQGLLDLGMQVKEMAEKTGRSDRFVRRRLKIARIPQETRDMSSDFSQLSLDQLDKLAEFESDPDMQRELARVHRLRMDVPNARQRTRQDEMARQGAEGARQSRNQSRKLPRREKLLELASARLQGRPLVLRHQLGLLDLVHRGIRLAGSQSVLV